MGVRSDWGLEEPASYRYGDSLPSESAILEQLLKATEIQQLFESCLNLVNIPLAIIDLEANVLLSSRWRRLCVEFHRVHPVTCERCLESDTKLARDVQERTGSYAIYRCRNGLTDCAAPILIDGKHVANVFIGQFLTAAPDEAWFRRQAEECAFDVDEYLTALREVPIVGEERIPAILDLLVRMTRLVTTLSIASKRAVDAQARQGIILDAIPQAVFWKDLHGRFLGCNAAFANAAGLEGPDEVVGKTDFDLPWPREQAEAFRSDDQAVVAAGQPRRHIVEPLQRADGSRIVVDTSKIPLTDPSGRAYGVLGIFDDITDRNQAEERINESEARFRTLSENSLTGIYIVQNGRVTYVNPALATMLGYEVAELIGTDPLDLFHPDDRPIVAENYRRRVAGEVDSLRYEVRCLRKDGQIVEIEILGGVMQVGGHPATVGAVLDMTERKRGERTRQHLAAIVEFSDDAIISKTCDGTILSWNKAAERLYGYEGSAMIGRSIRALVPDDRRDEFNGFMDRIARGEAVDHHETVRLRADGSRVDVSLTVSPIRDEAGRVVGASTIARDITQRIRAEERIVASEERFRAAFMNSSDACVIVQREDGRLLEVNDRFSEMYGYTRAECIGRTTLELGLWAKPEQRLDVMAELQRRGRVRDFPITAVRKGGHAFPVLYSVTPLIGAGQRSVYMGAVRDVTELASLEARLRQAQKLEAIGRLAGGVAHDFNNLLTIINGYADLLLRPATGRTTGAEEVREILTAGQRAASLTRQLLAFSRQQLVEPRVIDVNRLVLNLEKMLRRLIGEDIDLHITADRRLGQVRIDPGQLEQVILNLCVNARDAMPGVGKLTIETANATLDEAYARTHSEVTPGRYVLLSVTDSGTGMSQETLSHLFEPFFTTKEAGKGTGLGLSTVYGIIKQAGGHLSVYSEPGRGSTFRVYVPRIDAPADEADEQGPSERSRAGTETILVAEDESAVRAFVRTILEPEGYTVLLAENPAQALALLEGHPGHVDLLLTDVVMPGSSGGELAARLKALRPGIKVVFMSGYTGEAISRHAVLEPGVAFLQKPFSCDGLLEKLRTVLDEKKQSNE
jgi:two-component system, cell cycle sensor histidine kinase and response regulator CckA